MPVQYSLLNSYHMTNVYMHDFHMQVPCTDAVLDGWLRSMMLSCLTPC